MTVFRSRWAVSQVSASMILGWVSGKITHGDETDAALAEALGVEPYAQVVATESRKVFDH